ncbi:MAG: leucine-rich repeat protein, partial [Alistipes sp.]|nr:leucine-rich repeat protein [Alistipes sp.]
PDSVTSIEWDAFSGCTSLESFHGKFASEDNRYLIKDGVLLAFASNGLTEYTIPNSVALIKEEAFYGCTSLKSVYCKPTTPPRVYWSIKFHDNEVKPLGCKIYVPRASVEAYKTAEGWKEHADNIVGYDF